ncbi:MAG: ankyrin repeat domain-containing protein [Burkholderiales bacterium]
MRRSILALAAAWLFSMMGAVWGQALDQLLKAADIGDAKAVAGFLSQGLDPNSTDKQGNTLLMIAAVQGHEALAKLLIERKADVARRSPAGDSALMLASLKGHLGIVKLLIERGAPMSHSGWAPLHYAAFEGRTEVVKYLLEKGAEKDALAPNGYSALLLAMRNGHMEAARELLYADADVNIKGARGETSLSLAKGRNDKELEELIRRAGAVE